jgi:hypothetical protein
VRNLHISFFTFAFDIGFGGDCRSLSYVSCGAAPCPLPSNPIDDVLSSFSIQLHSSLPPHLQHHHLQVPVLIHPSAARTLLFLSSTPALLNAYTTISSAQLPTRQQFLFLTLMLQSDHVSRVHNSTIEH